MISLTVRHTTSYTYASPVQFGEHRMMLRPRDSHDLRLVSADLVLSPPGRLRWVHDVFGNSVLLAKFSEPGSELYVESTLRLERFSIDPAAVQIGEQARTWPFIYTSDDRTDLGRLLEVHHPDPRGQVAEWAHGFAGRQGMETLSLLAGMNEAIKAQFAYVVRHEEGTQTPVETLERGSGSCRDFALLMMEALRVLGLGTRFVSGYLYDPALDGGVTGTRGAGATHAWLEVYLPGAGWVEYDPTNATIGDDALIRIAVARDPAQAVPIAGSFTGTTSDLLGMTVDVEVTQERT